MRPLPFARSRRSLFSCVAATLFAVALAGGSSLASAQTKAETLRIGEIVANGYVPKAATAARA